MRDSGVVFDGLAHAFRNKMGEIWAACYPRVYKNPDLYPGHHHPAVDLGTLIAMTVDAEGVRKIEDNSLAEDVLAANKVVQGGSRTYFIAPEIFAALKEPHLGIPLQWTKMQLPDEGASFVFPKEGLTGDEKDDFFTFVWYARVRRWDEVRTPVTTPIRFGIDFFFVRTCQYDADTMHQFSPFNIISEKENPTLALKSGGVLNTLTNIVFNSIALINGYPDAVTEGQPSGKKTKSGQQFYTPTVIGQGLSPDEVVAFLRGVKNVPLLDDDTVRKQRIGETILDIPPELAEVMREYHEVTGEDPMKVIGEIGKEDLTAFIDVFIRVASETGSVPKNQIYAIKKTQMMASTANWSKMSPSERQEWSSAMAEYDDLEKAGHPPKLP